MEHGRSTEQLKKCSHRTCDMIREACVAMLLAIVAARHLLAGKKRLQTSGVHLQVLAVVGGQVRPVRHAVLYVPDHLVLVPPARTSARCFPHR